MSNLGSCAVAFRRMSSSDVCARRGSARHPYAVLMFQVAGELVADHGGLLDFHAGDVHLIPAGAPHRIASAKDAELWCASFRPAELDPARFAPLLESFASVSGGASPRFAIPEGRRAFVVELFSELEALAAKPERGPRTHAIRSESLAALLLAEVADVSAAPRAAPGTSDVTTRALAFIAAHARSSISLIDVARAVRRSRSSVADAVRRETGKSVGEWIAEIRLEDARRRLDETDELVEVIAERVGFADPTHFARTFKRRFGLAPRAWRSRPSGELQEDVKSGRFV